METQDNLSTSKLTVMADYRERETIEHLKSLGANVSESSLDVGDFVCSKDVVIERKGHSDFVSSIIDGRLFDQCRRMREIFSKPIVIIEGYSTRDISENALKAAIASVVTDFGVSLISTKNPADTAKTIYWIAKREQVENKKDLSLKVGKKPVEEARLQEFVVSSLPGVSGKTAKKILEEYGSVREFFSSDRERMEKVIGKKKAERVFELIGKKYSG